MAGRPADGVDPVALASSLREGQLHIGLHRKGGELALQLRAVLSIGARTRLPVQGKNQRVKDGRL